MWRRCVFDAPLKNDTPDLAHLLANRIRREAGLPAKPVGRTWLALEVRL